MESSGSQPGSLAAPVLTYLALGLVVMLLVKRLFTSTVHHKIPPCPVKPYPILGHLPYLSKGIRKQMTEWSKSSGEMYSLYFGPKLVVILNGYDVIYQAFVKQGDTLSDRPDTTAVICDGEDPNRGIAAAVGHVWKEQRSVALQILRSFGMGKNVLALKIKEEVSAYLDALAEFNGEPADIRLLTHTAVANIICSIIIGKRFNYDDAYFVKFADALNQIFQSNASASLFGLFPWLRYLPGDLFQAKKHIKDYKHIKENFCLYYINKIKSADRKNNEDNFISAYLREQKRLKNQGQDTTLDDENLTKSLYDLFLAGTDTTSTFLQWFMVNMLHHPDIQDKIFAEITEVVGSERTPDMQDKSKLNLLQAAILETLRLRIAVFNLPHQSRSDTELGGYTIPAGAMIISNFDSVHRAEDTYSEPTQFRPERYLDPQGNLLQPEKVIPFGVGKRACPGESLARMELYLFASALIQKFELQPEEPGELPCLEPVEGLVYSPQPFKIRFVARQAV